MRRLLAPSMAATISFSLSATALRVLVLRALDQEHHQERDDGRARVDDELPGVGIAEDRPRRAPHEDDTERDDERGVLPVATVTRCEKFSKTLVRFFMRAPAERGICRSLTRAEAFRLRVIVALDARRGAFVELPALVRGASACALLSDACIRDRSGREIRKGVRQHGSLWFETDDLGRLPDFSSRRSASLWRAPVTTTATTVRRCGAAGENTGGDERARRRVGDGGRIGSWRLGRLERGQLGNRAGRRRRRRGSGAREAAARRAALRAIARVSPRASTVHRRAFRRARSSRRIYHLRVREEPHARAHARRER